MKISDLKKMIHNEVRAAIREELAPILREVRTPAQQIQEPSGLDEIRRKFRSVQPRATESEYGDVGGHGGEVPKNPKVIKNGEVFASGKGIMEWFHESKNEEALDNLVEQKRKMAKTDEYLRGVLGRKL